MDDQDRPVASLALMPPDLRVCFFGDSLVAGVGDVTILGWVGRVVASARRDGADLTGYNLGVRGETGPEVHARWQAEARARLARGDGHGVVVSFGVNDTLLDGGHQRALEPDSLAALGRIADQAQAAAWPLLVVGPTLVDDPGHNRRILGLSAAMADRCADVGIPWVKLAPDLVDDAWLAEVSSRDGAHPGYRGYERLSSAIHPAFADWLPSLAAASDPR